MTATRVLFVLSADFGEYVTANLFSRGQPFISRFAMPQRLAQYCGDAIDDVSVYQNVEDLRQIIATAAPDVVVLCSGYLFVINGLIDHTSLARLADELRQRGIVVATTDPWLRVFALNPQAGFAIHSVRKGGVDLDASEKVMRLNRFLEELFHGAPHLLAVPLPRREKNWLPFFNPEFTNASGVICERRRGTEWLFVLAREDFVHLAGIERNRFFDTLRNRLDEVMSVAENHVIFIGPADMAAFFAERASQWPRLSFVPFCSFAAFEAAIRRASIVVYWNVLSASLLYCLYHGVPPVFFGRGHQIKVCPALRDHVIEYVYRGQAPLMLEFGAPLEAHAAVLVERHGLSQWLADIRRDYTGMPDPASVMQEMTRQHAVR